MAALLSFVEVVQFKEQCCRRLGVVDPGTFQLHSKLAPSIPRSIIVFNEGYPLADDISAESATESMGPLQQKRWDHEKAMKEFKCKAYMLWNKYIKNDAELQLNLGLISSRMP